VGAQIILSLFVALTGATASLAQSATPPLSTAHDGRWSVFLDCPDTRGSNGSVVKGYTYNFVVQIAAGRLEGEAKSLPPAFIHFTGQVLADGVLSIDANGVSGNPEVTVGKIPRGTPYRYTMKGKLEADRGRAERVELRPCTADFVRQNG
jgi:hypothetical protein